MRDEPDRMDAAAKTNEEWVAYKSDGGLKGFSTDLTPRVTGATPAVIRSITCSAAR